VARVAGADGSRQRAHLELRLKMNMGENIGLTRSIQHREEVARNSYRKAVRFQPTANVLFGEERKEGHLRPISVLYHHKRRFVDNCDVWGGFFAHCVVDSLKVLHVVLLRKVFVGHWTGCVARGADADDAIDDEQL